MPCSISWLPVNVRGFFPLGLLVSFHRWGVLPSSKALEAGAQCPLLWHQEYPWLAWWYALLTGPRLFWSPDFRERLLTSWVVWGYACFSVFFWHPGFFWWDHVGRPHLHTPHQWRCPAFTCSPPVLGTAIIWWLKGWAFKLEQKHVRKTLQLVILG